MKVELVKMYTSMLIRTLIGIFWNILTAQLNNLHRTKHRHVVFVPQNVPKLLAKMEDLEHYNGKDFGTYDRMIIEKYIEGYTIPVQ